MNALNEKPDEITLILSYDSQTVKTLKCNKNDKLDNIFKKYFSNIGVAFNNLFFYMQEMILLITLKLLLK